MKKFIVKQFIEKFIIVINEDMIYQADVNVRIYYCLYFRTFCVEYISCLA